MGNKYKYDAKVDKFFNASVEVKAENELLEEFKNQAYNELKESVRLRGFRQGKGPKNLIEASLGSKLYERTLDMILPQIMTEVIKEKSYRPITKLDYHVTKMDDTGLEFRAEFVNFPEFSLGNFGKIKIKKEEVTVKDEEIDKVVDNMLNDDALRQGKEKDKIVADDKWVEGLGMENIKTMQSLKDEIKKTILSQKEVGAEEKHANDVMMEAVKLSKIQVSPKILEREVEAREKSYKSRLENLGLNVDDFLKSQKTSLEDLRKQWSEEVESRTAGEFLLVKIAEEQKFDVDWNQVDEEIKAITDTELRREYSTPEGKMRVSEIMLRQKALKWLIDQVQK